MTGEGVLDVHAPRQFISLPPSLEFLEFAEMDINDVVYTVGYRPSLSEQKASITIETSRELPRIRGNQKLLSSVVDALLLRAKHSVAVTAPKTSMIHIRTWATDGDVRLSLSHNGFGAGPRDRVTPDSCLTLTKCAEIISDHGGMMWSWHPCAGGASYTIILPVLQTCDHRASGAGRTWIL